MDSATEKSEQSSISKKRGVQNYRKKWESIPQLRGWLKPAYVSKKDPYLGASAYCLYCKKTLVPHVTGLLKHASCNSHKKSQKAYMEEVRLNIIKAEKKINLKKSEARVSGPIPRVSQVASELIEGEENEGIDEKAQYTITIPDHVPECDISTGHTIPKIKKLTVSHDPDDPESCTTIHVTRREKPVNITVVMDEDDESVITTHIIDSSKGLPAVNVSVRLYKLENGLWKMLNESATDIDGMCRDLLKENKKIEKGRYKLNYDSGAYFSYRNIDSVYPFVEIVFDVKIENTKYHIPLLMSPHSYSTYRSF